MTASLFVCLGDADLDVGRANIGEQGGDDGERHPTSDQLCPTEAGPDDGAMPANVLENIRPAVMGGSAKLVELVWKDPALKDAPRCDVA
jgi:hypothetical protein